MCIYVTLICFRPPFLNEDQSQWRKVRRTREETCLIFLASKGRFFTVCGERVNRAQPDYSISQWNWITCSRGLNSLILYNLSQYKGE